MKLLHEQACAAPAAALRRDSYGQLHGRSDGGFPPSATKMIQWPFHVYQVAGWFLTDLSSSLGRFLRAPIPHF
jgi:hypothetical protein